MFSPIPPPALPRQDAASKLYAVLDKLPTAMGVCTPGPEGEILFLNAAFMRDFGYTRADIPAVRAWAVRAYPDEGYRAAALAWWNAAVAAALQGDGDVEARELQLTTKDGRPRSVLISASLLDETLLVSFTDMTARNRAEAERWESDERFRLAFDNSNAGMCLVDLQGRLFRVNRRMSELFGYSQAELETMTVDSLTLPEDLQLSRHFIGAVLGGQQEQDVFEKRYRHRQGHVIHALVSPSVVRDAEGQPLYFITQLQDITQRKQAEERLQVSEERYRLLAENTRDVIWTMELDGTISYVSPAVEQVRGITLEAAMRQPLEAIQTPASRAITRYYLRTLLAAVAAGVPPKPFRGELEYYRKDGSTFWAEVIAIPILREDGSFVQLLGVSRDIDQRKRYELELQQAREAADEANAAKSRFLAHMSHEIRTPMNGVLGMAQILGQEPLSRDQLDMVNTLQAAGQSLLSIINDILDFSKIEAGQLRLDPRPFNLPGLLANVIHIMRVTARMKGLVLRLETPPALATALAGDALRLKQILINLTGNALKFTERGEVVLRVLSLAPENHQARFRFEVRDTGIGIAPEALAHLFTPFRQADDSITRRFGGTGLGLTICKQLAELMGGRIGADSTVGSGSVFWVELPFAPLTGADMAALRAGAEAGSTLDGGGDQRWDENGRDARPPVAEAPLQGLRVLVVDDNRINRLVAERALQRQGAVTILANDGQEALSILTGQPGGFDAVLMDIQMPIMDGLTAVRAIRANPALARLPVFAMTAGVLEEERAAALSAGMDEIITKPIDLGRLTALLSAGPVERRGRPGKPSG